MVQQKYNYKVLKGDKGIDTVIIFCGLNEMNNMEKRQEMINSTGLNKDSHEFTFWGSEK